MARGGKSGWPAHRTWAGRLATWLTVWCAGIAGILFGTSVAGADSSESGAAPAAALVGSKAPDDPSLLKISVLDIGQGDSILIQTPNERTVLIDAGPSARQSLLLAQLARAGVQRIDLAVSTHPHEDHIGGFPAVLDQYPVRNFADPGTVHTTPSYNILMLKLKEKQVPLRKAYRGQQYKISNDLFLEVFQPREPLFIGTRSDLNNNSVVIRLTYKKFSMMFEGDAEHEAEMRLLKDGVVPVSVLKCGHHGSFSSTDPEYVDALQPQLAVLSCETGNDYGHPHEKTLTTLSSRKIPLFRTDREGQVRFLTDGEQLWVETYARQSLVAPLSQPATPTRREGPIVLRASLGPQFGTPGAAPTPPAPPPQPQAPAPTVTTPTTPSTSAETAPQPVAASPASSTTGASEGSSPESRSGTADAPSSSTPPSPEVTDSPAPEPAAQATPAPRAPIPPGAVVAAKKSHFFHLQSCAFAQKIAERNRIYYATRDDAILSGKVPSKDCIPE